MVNAAPLLLLLPALHGAAPALDKVQVATGALISFGSKRCQDLKADAPGAVEWPGLVYAPGTPPKWGTRRFTGCSGADTLVLQESLAAGVLWSTGDQEALKERAMEMLFQPGPPHAAFKAAFGWELPEPVKLGSNGVYRYDAKKLKQLFDQLYLKPADQVGTITAQKIYDLMLKKRLTAFARDAAFLNAAVGRAKRATLLERYRADLQTKGDAFDGRRYFEIGALLVLGQAQGREPAPETVRTGRTLGTILRRMDDGTWPTVVALLKKVLADYDPELFKELGKKL